jgi:hypothetical protein
MGQDDEKKKLVIEAKQELLEDGVFLAWLPINVVARDADYDTYLERLVAAPRLQKESASKDAVSKEALEIVRESQARTKQKQTDG